VLVASSEAIAADLGWHAERDLRSMVTDAWTFAQLGLEDNRVTRSDAG